MFLELFVCSMMGSPSVEYVQTRTLQSSTVDQNGNTFTITGLSGIVWGGDNSWFGVMDNSSHVVSLEVFYDVEGSVSVEVIGGVVLSRYGDYEDIAIGESGNLILSDETTQDLHVFDHVTGELIETYLLHDIYQTRRGNLGCEAFCSNQGDVWIGNEEALTGDGPRATPDNGTLVRLTHGAINSLPNGIQYAYEVDSMPGPYIPFTNDGQSGLVAIAALPSGAVLCLERSLAFVDALFKTKIYSIDFESATDIRDYPSLAKGEFTPCEKELLYEGPRENMEGLAVGPELLVNEYLLLGIVDDGDPISDNRINVFIVQDDNPCVEDINSDAVIGVSDVLIIIDSWGASNGSNADVNNDGMVDVIDLLQVVSAWGPC